MMNLSFNPFGSSTGNHQDYQEETEDDVLLRMKLHETVQDNNSRRNEDVDDWEKALLEMGGGYSYTELTPTTRTTTSNTYNTILEPGQLTPQLLAKNSDLERIPPLEFHSKKEEVVAVQRTNLSVSSNRPRKQPVVVGTNPLRRPSLRLATNRRPFLANENVTETKRMKTSPSLEVSGYNNNENNSSSNTNDNTIHRLEDQLTAWSPFVTKITNFMEKEDLPFEYADVWVYEEEQDSKDTTTKKKNLGCFRHVGNTTRTNFQPIDTIYHMTEFGKLSTKFTFRPGVGLPGRVFAAGTPIWDDSLQTADYERFPRVYGARKHGVKSAVGIPVITKDQQMVVVALYTRNDGMFKDWNLIQKCYTALQIQNPNSKNLKADLSISLSSSIMETTRKQTGSSNFPFLITNSHKNNNNTKNKYSSSTQKQSTNRTNNIIQTAIDLTHLLSPTDDESSVQCEQQRPSKQERATSSTFVPPAVIGIRYDQPNQIVLTENSYPETTAKLIRRISSTTTNAALSRSSSIQSTSSSTPYMAEPIFCIQQYEPTNFVPLAPPPSLQPPSSLRTSGC